MLMIVEIRCLLLKNESASCCNSTHFAREQNCLISRTLFSELYIIMVNEVTFVGFKEHDHLAGSVPGDSKGLFSLLPKKQRAVGCH